MNLNKFERWQLKQKQQLPLESKVILTEALVREWYSRWNGEVYVSFSGGKDSTVLLSIVRSMYHNIPAVFVDTGLEYPEIKKFVGTVENVTWIKPQKTFFEIIRDSGYPVISKKVSRQIRDLQNPTQENTATRRLYTEGIKKDGTTTKYFKLPKKWERLKNAPFKISEKCCDYLKKEPFRRYEKNTKKKPYIGTMASDSTQRAAAWLKKGCNSYEGKIASTPLSFWHENDIWDYIKRHNIPYSEIYDMEEKRTGCMFCMLGVHLEKGENRFQRMKKSHQKIYHYCMDTLGLAQVLNFIGVQH